MPLLHMKETFEHYERSVIGVPQVNVLVDLGDRDGLPFLVLGEDSK